MKHHINWDKRTSTSEIDKCSEVFKQVKQFKKIDGPVSESIGYRQIVFHFNLLMFEFIIYVVNNENAGPILHLYVISALFYSEL